MNAVDPSPWRSDRPGNLFLGVVTVLSAAWIIGELALHAAFGDTNMGTGSLISLAAWLVCVAVLWASVTWAAVTSLASVSLSLLVGLMPVQEILILIVMAGAVAIYSPPRVRRSFLLLSLIWTLWFASQVGQASSALPLGLLVMLLLMIAYGIGRAVRIIAEKRDNAQQQLAETRERHRGALAAQRRTLARDLHDIIAHDVTLMAMQAEAAQLSGDETQRGAALDLIRASSRSALSDLRRMVRLLRDDGVLDQSFTGSDDTYTEEVFPESLEGFREELQVGLIPVEVVITGDWDDVAYSTRHNLHQILKECVANVMKYGSAAAGVKDPHCSITAGVGAPEVWLRVTNRLPQPGHNSDSSYLSSGFGLESIRDRVETFGGELAAGPDGRGQWTCEVRRLGAA